MGEIGANSLLPKALKSCPKSIKSPNLVTLVIIKISLVGLMLFVTSAQKVSKLSLIGDICLQKHTDYSTLNRRDQCDQIGRFLKVHGDKFSSNTNPNVYLLLRQHYILVKTTVGNVGRHLATFIAPYGHTGHTGRDNI